MKKLIIAMIIALTALTTAQPNPDMDDNDFKKGPNMEKEFKGANHGFAAIFDDPKLNFSDNQKEQIRKLYKENRLKSIDIKANIDKIKIDGEELFTPKNYDEKKLRAHHKKLHEEMGKLINNRVELMIGIINIADEKQKEVLIPMMKNKMMFGHDKSGRRNWKKEGHKNAKNCDKNNCKK